MIDKSYIDEIVGDILGVLYNSPDNEHNVHCSMRSPYQKAIESAVRSGWISETNNGTKRSGIDFTMKITEEGKLYHEFLEL